jgi:hypothetical protein
MKMLSMLVWNRPVRLAYQPPASSTFLSQQISHQQPASSTFLSEQTSTSHQPPANRTGADQVSLFARLISHQPAVLFSQNEPATSNQPQPASSTLLSEQTSTSHQPPANRTGNGCI